MRFRLVLIVGATCVGLSAPSFAYEKYIPLGAGYATGKNVLPDLNSEEQALTAQTDIYESELYRKQLEQRRNQSYISHFSTNADSTASDYNLDY